MTVDLYMAYADARFDYRDLDTKRIGSVRQYLSYGIQTAHDGRLMHNIIICSSSFQFSSVQFSSVHFKMVSMRSVRPICAAPRLSGVSPMLPLKHVAHHVRFHDLDLVLDFENVCKARSSCFLCSLRSVPFVCRVIEQSVNFSAASAHGTPAETCLPSFLPVFFFSFIFMSFCLFFPVLFFLPSFLFVCKDVSDILRILT